MDARGRPAPAALAQVTAFLDANVVIYAFDATEPAKQAIARELLQAGGFVVSAQVLGEFYTVATRRLAQPPSVQEAADTVDALLATRVVALDRALVQAAIQTSMTAQLSYWDALIVEAAVAAGCDRVLTEDLNDGRIIRGVRIENPFTP